MTVTGTVRDGTIVLDPDTLPIRDGTRVEIVLRTGMEPHVRKTPGVCGGSACVGNRRIAVWSLVESRSLGIPDESLLSDFDPPLTRAELDAAWRYAAANPDEIAEDIRQNNDGE